VRVFLNADIDAAVKDAAKPLFDAADSMDARFGEGQWVACLVNAGADL
jgi:hypothetical protein